MKQATHMRTVLSAPPRARKRRKTPHRPRFLVLLVDDDPDLREMIKLALQEIHLGVIEAGTSKAALVCARRRKFDLVISDVSRPGMNGLRFLTVFKKEHAHIPVIIASGDPKGSTEAKARQLGAFAFLAKPFTLDCLLKVVSQALGTRRAGLAQAAH
jgi:DNA-binding NtrC family response regulator